MAHLAAALAVWAWVEHETNRSESQAEKEVCELLNGAGLCVKSNGEWVRIGSSPFDR
jgi:hypothetical protein